MSLIDGVLTNPLQGFFTGITFLVLANILVALLAGTVTRIYDQVVTYNVYQRGWEICSVEKSWSYEERKDHTEYINSRECNPCIQATSLSGIENKDAKIGRLQEELQQQKETLLNMTRSMESAVWIILKLKFYFIHFLVFRTMKW